MEESNGNRLVDLAQGLTRPLITLLFASTLSATVFLHISLPNEVLAIMGGAIGWWFITRTLDKRSTPNGQ